MRNHLLVSLAMISLAVAGCMSPANEPEATGHIMAAAGSTSSWSWNTTEVLDAAALVVAIRGPEDARCEIFERVSIRTGEEYHLMAAAVLYEWLDGTRARVLGGGGMAYGAYVDGFLDTREWGGSPGYLSWNGHWEDVPLWGGGLDVTVVGYDFAAPQSEETIALEIGCDQDIAVSVAGGRELVFLNPESWREGHGAWTPSASGIRGASVVLEGAVEASFSAPEVRLRGDSTGFEYGELIVRAPEGTTTWTIEPRPVLDPENLFPDLQIYEHAGGPGDYRVELTRVAWIYHSFWVALMGLHAVDHPDEMIAMRTA